MTIVAEGVEDPEKLRLLASNGCDEIQGYLIGHPEPLERLLTTVPQDVLDALNEDEPTVADEKKTA